MTDEVLKAIHAKTNAIDAVNAALKAEWEMIEELSAEAEALPSGENNVQRVRELIASLKALNSALPAAVVANVAPATAGAVGKSASEHIFEQADAIVAEGLAKVAHATSEAAKITEALRQVFEDLHQSAGAIGAGKAMKEASAGA